MFFKVFIPSLFDSFIFGSKVSDSLGNTEDRLLVDFSSISFCFTFNDPVNKGSFLLLVYKVGFLILLIVHFFHIFISSSFG